MPDASAPDSGVMLDSGVGPVISGIQPAAVREGEGDASNTRAIPISIVGSGFLPDAVVQTGNALVETVQSAVDATGDRIGVELRVRVDPTLLFGASARFVWTWSKRTAPAS